MESKLGRAPQAGNVFAVFRGEKDSMKKDYGGGLSWKTNLEAPEARKNILTYFGGGIKMLKR